MNRNDNARFSSNIFLAAVTVNAESVATAADCLKLTVTGKRNEVKNK